MVEHPKSKSTQPTKVFDHQSHPVREKIFGKSYSLDNSLWESIFREDLFLYNWLQEEAKEVSRRGGGGGGQAPHRSLGREGQREVQASTLLERVLLRPINGFEEPG